MYYDILGNLGRWQGTIYYVMLALIQYYTNEFYENTILRIRTYMYSIY